MALEVDTQRLWGLLADLDPKRRVAAMRNGMRAAARKVRQAAFRNLTSGTPALKGRTSEVAKGIRVVLYRTMIGFRVTVGTKRKTYDKGARDNKEKAFRRLRVVPLWAEGGTMRRRTRGGFFRKGADRGAMPAYRFMERAEAQTMPGIQSTIRQEIDKSIERSAKKYGSSYNK